MWQLEPFERQGETACHGVERCIESHIYVASILDCRHRMGDRAPVSFEQKATRRQRESRADVREIHREMPRKDDIAAAAVRSGDIEPIDVSRVGDHPLDHLADVDRSKCGGPAVLSQIWEEAMLARTDRCEHVPLLPIKISGLIDEWTGGNFKLYVIAITYTRKLQPE